MLLVVMAVGCAQEGDRSINPDSTQLSSLEIERVITLLKCERVAADDSVYLANLSDSNWQAVIKVIEERGIIFFPASVDGQEVFGKLSETACAWAGTTRWNQSLTKARGYKYQGHNAVYFTVAANAACYCKNADWWVYTWTPTHGDAHDWYLLLHRDRYWNGSAWVKDIVLLVPTTWWWVYYPHWPSSFKAGRFYIHWNSYNNGCCE